MQRKLCPRTENIQKIWVFWWNFKKQATWKVQIWQRKNFQGGLSVVTYTPDWTKSPIKAQENFKDKSCKLLFLSSTLDTSVVLRELFWLVGENEQHKSHPESPSAVHPVLNKQSSWHCKTKMQISSSSAADGMWNTYCYCLFLIGEKWVCQTCCIPGTIQQQAAGCTGFQGWEHNQSKPYLASSVWKPSTKGRAEACNNNLPLMFYWRLQ